MLFTDITASIIDHFFTRTSFYSTFSNALSSFYSAILDSNYTFLMTYLLGPTKFFERMGVGFYKNNTQMQLKRYLHVAFVFKLSVADDFLAFFRS